MVDTLSPTEVQLTYRHFVSSFLGSLQGNLEEFIKIMSLITQNAHELVLDQDSTSQFDLLLDLRANSLLLTDAINDCLVSNFSQEALAFLKKEKKIIFSGSMPWDMPQSLEYLQQAYPESLDVTTYEKWRTENEKQNGIVDVLVILGREDYDKDMLFEMRSSWRVYTDFVAQEDFINFLMTGNNPNYFYGDTRIEGHPALSYLANIGFKWPSMELGLRMSVSSHYFDEDYARRHGLAEESCLKRVGYSARKGVTSDERREFLRIAIRDDHCGFKNVVMHLAMLVNVSGSNPNLSEVNQKRIEDLNWLKQEFYKPPYNFPWPQY